MSKKYITQNELKTALYSIVDQFVDSLEEGTTIQQLTILNEVFHNNWGITLRGIEVSTNFIDSDYRVDTLNNRYAVINQLSSNDELNKEFTTASKEWLEDMEEFNQ